MITKLTVGEFRHKSAEEWAKLCPLALTVDGVECFILRTAQDGNQAKRSDGQVKKAKSVPAQDGNQASQPRPVSGQIDNHRKQSKRQVGQDAPSQGASQQKAPSADTDLEKAKQARIAAYYSGRLHDYQGV